MKMKFTVHRNGGDPVFQPQYFELDPVKDPYLTPWVSFITNYLTAMEEMYGPLFKENTSSFEIRVCSTSD